MAFHSTHLGVDHTGKHELGVQNRGSNSACGHKLRQVVLVVYYAWPLAHDAPLPHELPAPHEPHDLHSALRKRNVLEVEPVTNGDGCVRCQKPEHAVVAGKNSWADEAVMVVLVHILKTEMDTASEEGDQ
jgi:hypothetical protein